MESPTRDAVEQALTHDHWCDRYGPHRECCPGKAEFGCRGTVADVLNVLIERGWLTVAKEDGSAVVSEVADTVSDGKENALVGELRRRVNAARHAYLVARSGVDEHDDGDCQLGWAISLLAETLGADDPVVQAVARELLGTPCHIANGAARITAAVDPRVPPPPPMYPGTKFLTLCTLDGRRRGEVTVGESRLPVASALATVRAHGVAEAACMWPQLTEQELAVLDELVTDLDADTQEREARFRRQRRSEVEWILADALGYPLDEDGDPIIGDHTPVTLATEACRDIRGLRAELRELNRSHDECHEQRDAARAEIERLRSELATAEAGLRVDGDLLSQVIADTIPEWMTDQAARELAESALARLAAVPGVIVVRGPDSEPWTPAPPDESEPTAADPHRIELCWTPDQNNGQVSAFPNRSPVTAIVSQLHAGEPPDEVATDFDLTVDGVRLLGRLADELAEVVSGHGFRAS